MKKTILLTAATVFLGLSMNACGIKAVDPEPIPLTKAHLGEMALDITSIPNDFQVCGKKVSEFKQSMRNGFDYMASNGKVASVVSPEQATSTLIIDSLETTCLGDGFVDGSVIIFNFEFTWKFKDGSEFKQGTKLVGASTDGPKAALRIGIQNMYNYAFSSYLTKLNLGSNVK
jgi:hypothetical protein